MVNFLPIKAVVLAAGTSSRMGDFKPLLPIQGIPMLELVLRNVLSFPFENVMAIIGHNENKIKDAIHIPDQRFEWVSNINFHEGLSSSIKTAVQQCNDETCGLMVFLGDQPLLKKSTIQQMIQTILETNAIQSKYIIQPIYNSIPGHPVYISSQLFPYVGEISGDQGAKAIFKFADKHFQIPIDDEGTILDADTYEDYQDIIQKIKKSF
ncbi:nucleotidyltransferase family protein [Bacillus sp. FJAT-29953]|nr:nucleotidyltransferase family protein [Bacillus sp. FJAT-29953]